jgi:hypothetical protein
VIQRFCFVKLHDAEVDGRSALAIQLAAELREAGADAVVGVPADASAARWDLSLVITAATLEDWHGLAERPAIAAVFERLGARAAVVKAWTFESADA